MQKIMNEIMLKIFLVFLDLLSMVLCNIVTKLQKISHYSSFEFFLQITCHENQIFFIQKVIV